MVLLFIIHVLLLICGFFPKLILCNTTMLTCVEGWPVLDLNPCSPTIHTTISVIYTTAIETITADMLQTVWNELDYRVDVCRITDGAHIEHL